MKIKLVSQSAAIAVAVASLCGPAHADGDAKDLNSAGSVAGILAGIAAAGTIVTEATTRSKVSIVVDVYQDTELLPGKPAFPEDPKNRRSKGFRLDRPSVGYYPSPADARLNDDQRKELDALRLTAVEHQSLQTRWAQDTQTLEAVRAELACARADLTKERERREQAEAEALRAGVRRDTLEQLLAQLRPDHTDGSSTQKNPATG